MMENPGKQIVGSLLLLFLSVLISVQAQGKEIVDMAGRRVIVPDRVTKAYGASPPATYLLYAVDPALLAGLNYPFNPRERTYLRPDVVSLPVIGGWFGQGRTPNQETLLKVKPDVMVAWIWKTKAANEKIEQVARLLGLPLVYVRLDHLGEYSEAFLFIGRLVGREERGRKLSEYAKRTLADVEPVVAAVPVGKRVSIYYAEAPDGLSTECDGSPHTELINLAGGQNIYRCAPKDDFGMERISIEQVMLADPEVILAQEKECVDRVRSDPGWKSIRAVKNGRVHLIPRAPFNWFDRPPSFMRLLGIKWLTNLLYPDRYPLDLAKETREFYRLFLNVELDDGALREVLHQ
ncbi:MAG TPA: ABC transporter substrate-binding protein [Syntrophobacter fumaroxidans]|nr:ABC transporter substrate-binding protein [Syntrophobacter fumaroxidans]